MNKDSFEKLVQACDENIVFYAKHLENLKKYLLVIDNTNTFLDANFPEAKREDFIEAEQLINLHGFLAILFLDLSVVLKNTYLSKTSWEKNFFIKNGYLLIHEACEKLDPRKGEPYIKQQIFANHKNLKESYEGAVTNIKEFKNRPIYNEIEEVRHKIAGHRDKKLKKHITLIESLNDKEAFLAINDFIQILNEFLKITAEYVNSANIKKPAQKLNSNQQAQFLIIKDILKFPSS
jgi:hypothetical protein